MNKEEILNKYIDLIDKGYCCACNELNCIDNFPHAKITHSIRELQQENQELKKENKILRENAEHNDKVVDKVNWENQLLKKQLEEANEELELVRCDLHNRTSERDSCYRNIEILQNQQKDFIEYLNSYIELLSNKPDLVEEGQKEILEEILSKYKESGEQ